jgi:hypothetical protein
MDSETGSGRQKFAVVVRNARSTQMKLVREPYGDDFSISPGAAFEIRAEGPEGDPLEIDVEADSIVVWGWSGSVLNVYHDGVALSGSTQAVPPIPEGMSVRGFLGMVLGQPKAQDPD